MAEILTFERKYQPQRATTAQRAEQCSADVIIFPGVRYEHWNDENERKASSETDHSDEACARDVRQTNS